MKIIPRILGSIYENQALSYLKKHGLRLLDKNYATKIGEIDLVMQDDDCLVFVEVRARKSSRFGSAIDTVRSDKQKRIVKTAQMYILQHDYLEFTATRFDVVGITENKKDKFVWIKNAFTIDF